MWADCTGETGRTTNVFRTNLTVKSKVEYFKCQLFRNRMHLELRRLGWAGT